MPDFGAELKAAREAARKLTRAQLASTIGVTADAVINWERDPSDRSHRTPTRENIAAMQRPLGLQSEAVNRWMDFFGHEHVPDDRLMPLRDRRKTLKEVQAECESYPWPCLAMNEDFEAVAWNDAADDLSELDMARDLAEPGARHLLRMALSPHYKDKLTNWPDVIGIMMAMYKNGGHNFMDPSTLTSYQQRLLDYVFEHHETELGSLMVLWNRTQPHAEGNRDRFDATWRTSDGTELRFHCAITTWSSFDGTGAFDWHPADAPTWRWLDTQRAKPRDPRESGARRPAEMTAGELLQFDRKRHGLTQAELATRARRSESLIAAIEEGRKPLTEATALAIGRALDLDWATLNAMMDAAGLKPGPSAQSDYQLGHAFRTRGKMYSINVAPRVHWSEPQIVDAIEKHLWPVIVVNGRCEVVATNDRCRAAIGLDVRERPPGPARNLVAIVSESWFREGVENWELVVSRILPRDLEIYASPPGQRAPDKDDAYFDSVMRHVIDRDGPRGRSATVLKELNRIWHADPSHRQSLRVSFQLRMRPAVRGLAFNAVITPWNAMIDPYWVIDLHPADAQTWESLEVVHG